MSALASSAKGDRFSYNGIRLSTASTIDGAGNETVDSNVDHSLIGVDKERREIASRSTPVSILYNKSLLNCYPLAEDVEEEEHHQHREPRVLHGAVTA